MPQISLYIDEKTLKMVENAAMRQRVSISKWVGEQIRAKVEPVYPVDYGSLFGSISDDTFIKPAVLSFETDIKRDRF